MFEPITLSVSDLAKRWQTTNRHILEMALSLRLPLYFFFDGLTLDVNDRWNQHGGDDLSARALIQSQEGPEALAEALEAREETRRKAAFNGSLRIPPQTILQLMNQGAVPAPGLAYAPSAPIELVDIGQQRGSKEPFLVWEGALLSLEPSQQACILTCENVFALANEVGAIEAQQTGEPRAETKERGHQKIIDAADPVRRLLTKAQLIAEHERQWPTIENDLKEISRGGIYEGLAAARVKHGVYDAHAATAWAIEHARMRAPGAKPNSVFSIAASRIHKIE